MIRKKAIFHHLIGYVAFIVILLTNLISCEKLSAQSKSFDFKGQVFAYGETLKGAKLEIYQSGDLVEELYSKGGGKFQFELTSESEYMVEVSKENMRTKTIWINTKGTEKIKSKIPAFAFDVFLKKEKRTIYDELSEIPVTLIKYQLKKNIFYMDKTYSAVIKNLKTRIKDNQLKMR